jgi:hypothetical protein
MKDGNPAPVIFFTILQGLAYLLALIIIVHFFMKIW